MVKFLIKNNSPGLKFILNDGDDWGENKTGGKGDIPPLTANYKYISTKVMNES